MNKIFAAASAAVGLATLALAPTAVQAQDPTGPAMVDFLLNAVSDEFGLTVQSKTTGSLRQGASGTGTLQVRAGSVVFIGVCDENCSDVDMIVRDSSGREVGRDFEEDDTPLVILDGAAAGRYTVEVQMPGCSGTCNWGVAAYN